MKRLSIVLAVLVLLALAQASQAADLQAGWYARMYSVQYYAYDSHGIPTLITSGVFQTEPGVYGPFLVTNAPYHWDHSREASVPVDSSGVSPADSVLLPLSNNAGSPEQGFAYITFVWETNYDPIQMQLEFWHKKGDGSSECLWRQGRSGPQIGSATTAYGVASEEGFFFKVNVVPEPSAFLATLSGLLGGIVCFRWRLKL